MALSVDLSDDKMQDGADTVAPGKAHLVLQKFEEFKSKNGDHIAEFEVVAHDNANEIGKIHKEYFPQKSTVAWKLRTLAIACGLTTMDECQKAKEEGRAIEIEYQDAIGRQLFATFAANEYQGKTSVRLEGNMWPLTSEKCKGHPRNIGMLKRSGVPLESIPAPATATGTAKTAGGNKAAASSVATKPTSNATPPAPAANVEDAFGL